MRVCIGMALVFAMLLDGPTVVPIFCAEYQVTLGDTTGNNYSGTPPFQSAAQRTPGRDASCACGVPWPSLCVVSSLDLWCRSLCAWSASVTLHGFCRRSYSGSGK